MKPNESLPLESSPRYKTFKRWLRRLTVCSLVVVCLACLLLVYARGRVTAMTSESPQALPKVYVSRDQMAALEKRLGKISSRVETGASMQSDFLIAPEEINALIHKDARLRDKVFIKIADGALKADVCFPADVLPGGAGRYFNAEVTLNAAVNGGRLQLFVIDALVDGQTVSEMWMKLVRERNFATPLYNDAEISQILANVEGVTIEAEGVRFHLRGVANEKQIALQARKLDRQLQIH